MTYEIMYCPICGTQSEAEHMRTYPDSTKKKLECRICGHTIYMEITELQMGHRRGDRMKQDGYLFEAMKTYIEAKTPFRLGQRGICVDFRWDNMIKMWVVRIPRAHITLSVDGFRFDDCNNMVLKGRGTISLDEYESVKPLEERI